MKFISLKFQGDLLHNIYKFWRTHRKTFTASLMTNLWYFKYIFRCADNALHNHPHLLQANKIHQYILPP